MCHLDALLTELSSIFPFIIIIFREWTLYPLAPLSFIVSKIILSVVGLTNLYFLFYIDLQIALNSVLWCTGTTVAIFPLLSNVIGRVCSVPHPRSLVCHCLRHEPSLSSPDCQTPPARPALRQNQSLLEWFFFFFFFLNFFFLCM